MGVFECEFGSFTIHIWHQHKAKRLNVKLKLINKQFELKNRRRWGTRTRNSVVRGETIHRWV